ncbi:hypothetical protein D7V86_03560 [bacterium D16-51]|nr:hypothetical protein D7V96_00360 [bacterium D16-59]RKI61882.1 hypothetical protein D7V86_03560 [bacterium D16-51]
MDRKSFFRGFGSGVIFASLILGISFMVRTSDPYVTSRAKELGMVYESDSGKLLAENEGTKETAAPEKTSTPGGEEGEKTPVPSDTAKKDASPAPTSEAKPSEAPTKSPEDEAEDIKKQLEKEKDDIEKEVKKEQKKQEQEKKNQQKKLTINAGDWSSDVSEELERLGIVSNAKDFDKYLNDNGYSSSISAGTYDVSVKDTYAELARKITGK